jgi:hypothetical protein
MIIMLTFLGIVMALFIIFIGAMEVLNRHSYKRLREWYLGLPTEDKAAAKRILYGFDCAFTGRETVSGRPYSAGKFIAEVLADEIH